jgi:hypothetical protein
VESRLTEDVLWCMAAGLVVTALEDDGTVGDNPFVNFARRQSSKKISNGGVKDVTVRC